MTPMLKKLSRWFGGKESPPEEVSRPEKAARIAEEIRSRAGSGEASESPPASMMPPREEAMPAPPPRRRVIQAPVLVEAVDEPEDGKIRIKAQPSREGDTCKFMVNRDLFAGHSWYFPDFESAEGSPLAERIFSLDEVESLLIHGSTATVTRKGGAFGDWKPLAEAIGAAIREVLEQGEPWLSKKITEGMPSEDTIRGEIQRVIDEEVNPGVAGHGGKITLTRVEGNTVTILMGGGCQGCSAADLTLKQGIHNAFRKAVPYVGAIYDETDHAAGENPYYR